MRSASSLVFCLIMLVAAVGSSGCTKNEEPSNPNLKVPDVPPSAHGSKGALTKPGSKK